VRETEREELGRRQECEKTRKKKRGSEISRVDVQQQRSKQMCGKQACSCGLGREEGMDGWMEGRVEEQRGRKSGGCGGDGGGIGEWKG